MIKRLTLMSLGTKINNIFAYIIGNYRYNLYYEADPYKPRLMRQHIFEQIRWRIRVMDKECYTSGSCKLCGCKTTALQMANKACDKPCYPKMMNRKKWLWYRKDNNIFAWDLTTK